MIQYVTDVLKNLSDNNIYIQQRRNLITTKIAALILINEYVRANSDGLSWSLTRAEIVNIIPDITCNSINPVLKYLCEVLHLYECRSNPKNSKELVYSPIVGGEKIKDPLFIDLAYEAREFSENHELLQSPRISYSNSIFKAFNQELSEKPITIDRCSKTYALIGYNPESFFSENVPIDLKVSSASYTNSPKLKSIWLDINKVTSVPKDMDLASYESFFTIVTPEFISVKGMNRDKNALPIKFIDLAESYWQPSIPLGTREATLLKHICKQGSLLRKCEAKPEDVPTLTIPEYSPIVIEPVNLATDTNTTDNTIGTTSTEQPASNSEDLRRADVKELVKPYSDVQLDFNTVVEYSDKKDAAFIANTDAILKSNLPESLKVQCIIAFSLVEKADRFKVGII